MRESRYYCNLCSADIKSANDGVGILFNAESHLTFVHPHRHFSSDVNNHLCDQCIEAIVREDYARHVAEQKAQIEAV